MTYSTEVRENVREWAAAQNWGTAAAARIPAPATLPADWVENSTATRGALHQRLRAAVESLTVDQFALGPHELISVVIFENDCFGIASTPGSTVTTAIFLCEACLPSLHDAWQDYKDNLAALQIGRAETTTIMRLAKMGKQEDAVRKLKKTPVVTLDVTEQKGKLGLDRLTEDLDIHQGDLDTLLLLAEKRGAALPYVILATAPWTPKSSGWDGALEEKKEKKLALGDEGLEIEDCETYGANHKAPIQQSAASLPHLCSSRGIYRPAGAAELPFPVPRPGIQIRG